MPIWVLGISLTLPVTTVFSMHSNRSTENETKVHGVSKTDCLVSRVSAVAESCKLRHMIYRERFTFFSGVRKARGRRGSATSFSTLVG